MFSIWMHVVWSCDVLCVMGSDSIEVAQGGPSAGAGSAVPRYVIAGGAEWTNKQRTIVRIRKKQMVCSVV